MKESKRDLKISLVLSLILTVIMMVLFLYMHTDIKFAYGVELYLFGFICLLGVMSLGCWIRSIKKYCYLELEALGRQESREARLQVACSVVIMVAFWIALLRLIGMEGIYLISHWLYINELLDWIGIMTLCVVICAVCLILIIFLRCKINSVSKCIVSLLTTGCIVVALIVGISNCIEHAEEEAFWIRLHKSVDFTEEHGPYVENPYLP